MKALIKRYIPVKLISQNSRIPHKWKYEYAQLGFNYRMPSINAQLGIAQMKKLVLQ